MQLISIKHILVNYNQYLVIYYLLSINCLLIVIVTINIDYNKKLSNLIKIYINNIKYSSNNNSFIFKLLILLYLFKS